MAKTVNEIVAIRRLERLSQVNKRQEYNRELVREISNMVETYPDLRLCQILYDLHIIEQGGDFFNEEPQVTLDRVRTSRK